MMTRLKLLVVLALLCLVVPLWGAREIIREIQPSTAQFAVAVNAQGRQIYLAGVVDDGGSGTGGVSVYDATTGEQTCAIPLGRPSFSYPNNVAADPGRNRIYVTNAGGTGTVTVVDAASCRMMQDIPLFEPVTREAITTYGGIAVDATLNKIYATGRRFTTSVPVLVVLDGNTNQILEAIPTGRSLFTNGVTVNSVTHQVYVSDNLDNTVTVIDGVSHAVIAALPVFRPMDVAIDQVTNTVYISSPRYRGGGAETFSGVSVFDGATNTLLRAVPFQLQDGVLAINPQRNELYVGSTIRNAATLELLDSVSVAGNVIDLDVDPATNRIFVLTNWPRLYIVGERLASDAGPDQTVSEGQRVTVEGAADGGSPPYAFLWTQTAGLPVSLSDPTVPSPEFRAPDGPDTLSFTLTVTDVSGRTATDAVRIDVSNVNPTADAGPSQTVVSGDLVTIVGTGSDLVDPITFSWRQTSGQPVTLSCVGSRCTFTAPPGPDELMFLFTVRDDDGGIGTSSTTVTVRPNVVVPPPRLSVTLTADPTTVLVGQTITVSWQATGAVTQRDWIGLFEKGSRNTQYGCWSYTLGAPSGSRTCPAPNYPATFEFRYCVDNGYECVATSNPVTVNKPDPPKVVATLTAAPTTVLQQERITVSWQASGPIVSTDWIGLFRVGSANISYLTWFLTAGARSGSNVVPAAYGAGTFEFRYCLDFGYTCVATSNPVTMQ